MGHPLWLCCLAALATGAAAAPVAGQGGAPLTVEVEAGPVWQLRNLAQSPPASTATRVSIADLTGPGPRVGWRTTVAVDIDERHGLRVVFAPLSLDATVTLQDSIRFGGESFEPETTTWVRYASSFFRGTYRVRVAASERVDLRLGLTAQIRDGMVTLEQPGVTRARSDLGFTPLLHVAGEWRPGPRWRLGLEGDAITLGTRRTTDASLRLAYDAGRHWSLALGYRTIEGGLESSQLHSFAWFHSAVAGVAYRF